MDNRPDNELRLLLDLDAMLDTRMGTLFRLDPQATDWFNLEAYRNRTKDDFTELTGGRITTEQFQEQYARRDVETLKHSVITGVIPILINYIESMAERLYRGVDITSVRVDINTFPYVLAPILRDAFVQTLHALLPEYTVVRAIRLDPVKTDVEFMKTYYNGWMTYDFHTWLNVHHQDLLVKRMNDVSVILPKLFMRELGEYTEDVDISDELRQADKHGLFELVMEDFVHLEHMPVEDFCFIIQGRYKLPQDSGSSALTASEN